MDRRHLALFVAQGLFVLSGIEGFVALTHIDMKLLRPLLYFQGADLKVHRVSDNLALHYELAPSAVALYARGGWDPGLKKVTVNSLGFRGKERSKRKPAGVKRIVCVGASNTYGAAVNDEETYPAYLEASLNQRSHGSFEVWNAGVSAYVLSQNVEQAKFIVDHYSPDLLIFQVSNQGRRAFLLDAPFEGFFGRDVALYRENLRFCWPRPLDFLGRWRFLRTAAIAINGLVMLSADQRHPEYASYLGDDDFNIRAFLEFYRQYRDSVPMFFLSYRSGILDARLQALGIPNIDLAARLPKDHPPEYDELHPPAYVYKWYAKIIQKALIGSGLFSLVEATSKPPAGGSAPKRARPTRL